MLKSNKPSYRPLKNDGSTFKCCECEKQGAYNKMWYVTTPDGLFAGVYHKDCVDQNWIKRAEFISEPI